MYRSAPSIAADFPVKIALVSLNDSTDVLQWSGLNYFIARAMERAGAELVRVGPLESAWTPLMRLRQRWYDATNRTYHAITEPASLRALGESARARIPGDVDAVLSVTSLVAAAVGKLDVPHVSWDDATNAGMEQYYPDFRRMAPVSARQSQEMGQAAVDAVDLAVYASEWAAESARRGYGADASRIAVVPFGANLETLPSDTEVADALHARSNDVCHLLWIGVDWIRKGGAETVAITKALRERGVKAELTVVGCEPTLSETPIWIHREGFISKRDVEGRTRLAALFSRSHFFVMPSSAEAYGLVYAEASAFGVPSVALRTGGVPTIILDGETGLLEPTPLSVDRAADRIERLWRDNPRYRAMAQAARQRATDVLNWNVAGARMLALINQLCSPNKR